MMPINAGTARVLFQVTAVRIRKGEAMGDGFLNTCKWRDASVAEEDVWEFSATAVMADIDDPESLFTAVDVGLWAAEADRLSAVGQATTTDPVVVHMAAVYTRPEEPDEYDMGVEFVGWVDWPAFMQSAGVKRQ